MSSMDQDEPVSAQPANARAPDARMGYAIAKRAFDLAAATVGLVLSAPLLVITVVAIRLETKGPGIFAQKRVGRDGQIFTCYKLRTMHQGVGDKPSHHTDSSSITPLGTKLRRLKLDELPQLWNVACGEMSLVGPRPCLPTQVELIMARRAHGVLQVRPGITGLAQVRGVDMSDPQLLARVDSEYLQTCGFIGDLALVLRTITGAGRGDAVR